MTARDLLINISPKNDRLLFVQGFAQLCIAGATLSTIGTTVVSYTTSSGSDFTVLGQLARNLAPWSASKEEQIVSAIDAFNQITDPSRKAYSLLLARMSRLAMIIAKAAQGRGTVVWDDISPASSCTSDGSCPAGGMGDSDALQFKAEIITLNNDASSLQLTGLRDLSDLLNSSFGVLVGADAIRYKVRNSIVPAN